MQFIIHNITDDKINKAIQAIKDNGGMVEGNNFSVYGVNGAYFRHGHKLAVDIESKPFLASWAMIENKLNEFFG